MSTNQDNNASPDKILFYAFCILLLWLPLPLGSFHPWAWSVMAIWIYLLTASWCWLYFRNKVTTSVSFRSSWLVLLVFVLWLLFIAIQLMPLPTQIIDAVSSLALAHWSSLGDASLSIDIKKTRASWLLSLSYALVFFLTLVLINNRNRLKIIAYTLVFSGLFQAMYGALLALSTPGSVAEGTFFNRNHLAGYLEMTIAIGIGLLIALLGSASGTTLKKRTLKLFRLLLSAKAGLRASLVIMVIALVLTHSRMGNTAFFVSLFTTGTIGLIFSKYATRSVVILLVSLVLIDILIVGQWFGLDKVKQRLEQTSAETEIRDEVDIYALRQWSDYRLTGSGLGSFYVVFPQYRGADIPVYHLQTHNDYLQFATETGVIGLILLSLITVSSLFAALLAQYRRRDPLMRGMSFASIMGITAILIHSSVDFNLQIPANAATFVIMLALAWTSLFLGTGKSAQHGYDHQNVMDMGS
jgi:O-antigen ligase